VPLNLTGRINVTMPRIAVPAVLLALIASLGFAACGGSDDEDKPTKAEYITQGDAICKKGDDEILAEAQQQFGNKQPTEAEVTKFTQEVTLPNIEQQSKDLKALEKPEGDEEELDALYESLDKSIETAKNTDGTLDESIFAETNAKAQAYGFKECGSDD
jgi:hypothetical protein